MMKFGWDTGKAAANLRKLGVPFNEAKSVFLGQIAVFHTHRPGVIRIICARSVTHVEWKLYEED
ncbi:MAG: hypothetical protein NUV63_05245 [Gallionella sp.]|nr:hypothetical protein [Gallionella sp.]